MNAGAMGWRFMIWLNGFPSFCQMVRLSKAETSWMSDTATVELGWDGLRAKLKQRVSQIIKQSDRQLRNWH